MDASDKNSDGKSFADLPSDIVRMIIPKGESHRMRLINRKWNRLSLEYLNKPKPIETVDIYPGDIGEDVKIEMRINEEYLGHFDVAYWNRSEYREVRDDQNMMGVISPTQRIARRFTDLSLSFVRDVLIISVFSSLISFVLRDIFFLASFVSGTVSCTLVTCICFTILCRFFPSLLNFVQSILRNLARRIVQAISHRHPNPSNFLTKMRLASRGDEAMAGPKTEKIRAKLRRQFESCSGIGLVRINDIDLRTFDALTHCLGSVQIGRMEMIMTRDSLFNDQMFVDAFETDIKEMAQKHGMPNGLYVNGRLIQ